MSDVVKALALGLVCFLAVNLCASLLALLVGGLRPAARAPAVERARELLVLRLLPAATSLLALLALFVPAYLRHEPRQSGETLGPALLALAALPALLLGRAAFRGWLAMRETGRLARAFDRDAQPLSVPGLETPAYRITHPFPVVTVLGVLRPRLYVAGQVLSALRPAELQAVLDHELAHLRSRDNLKHWLLQACPDLLASTPWSARRLREWLSATEEAADERAAGAAPLAALDLAAALVKVARLVPKDRAELLPGLALHNGADLTRRVRRLLDEPRAAGGEPSRHARTTAAILLAAALPFYPAALRFVHGLSERLLALLS